MVVTPAGVSAGTVMGVFLMTVIVLGYVVLWALWHFVFRKRDDGEAAEGDAAAAAPPEDRR